MKMIAKNSNILHLCLPASGTPNEAVPNCKPKNNKMLRLMNRLLIEND